ncbi:MAG TPA: L-2-amino-thiazoline-4-carboxylic acid hydrolase [Anaerolineales bacterium]
MENQKLTKNRDSLLFGLGLAAGVTAGIALRQRSGSPPQLPQAAAWQRALEQNNGERQAALLIAQAQARFAELYARRPHFEHSALRMHLEQNILPGLALYQVLFETAGDQEAALVDVDLALIAGAQQGGQQKLFSLAQRLPDPFAILRLANRWMLRSLFPASGWDIRWLEDNPDCVAYNIHDCFYRNVLAAYKAPELTAHFCKLDDEKFGSLPYTTWERTQTLGRGDPYCNFRFRRVHSTYG